MSQSALFVTDIYDALGDIVRALGGPKKVGTELRPDKPCDEAAKWVKDCLNRERREKFDPESVLWLLKRGRQIGCHAAMNYICEASGYSAPQPTEPEDELARLQRDYIQAVRLLAQITPRIEEAQGKAEERGVKPAARATLETFGLLLFFAACLLVGAFGSELFLLIWMGALLIGGIVIFWRAAYKGAQFREHFKD